MTEAQKTARQQTLQQRRAAKAWEQTNNAEKGFKPDDRKKYGSLVRGLPALIQSDGLGQTLAFLLAKAKMPGEIDEKKIYSSEHYAAYCYLASWLAEEFQDYKAGISKNLMEWLIYQNTPIYRRVTTETLAYLVWLKRFAEAKGWQEDTGSDSQ